MGQAQDNYVSLNSPDFQISFGVGQLQHITYLLSAAGSSLQVIISSHYAATYSIGISLKTGVDQWVIFLNNSFVISPGTFLPLFVYVIIIIFLLGAPSPSTAIVSYPPSSGQVGISYSIGISAFDKYNNTVSSLFEVTICDDCSHIFDSPSRYYALTFAPNSMGSYITDSNTGSFAYTINTTVSANYSMSLTTAGDDLPLFPFAMEIFPGIFFHPFYCFSPLTMITFNNKI